MVAGATNAKIQLIVITTPEGYFLPLGITQHRISFEQTCVVVLSRQEASADPRGSGTNNRRSTAFIDITGFRES